LLDLLSEALDEIIIVKENGLTRKIRKRGAIMKQLVNKAVSGDVRSLKVVLEALGPNSERGRKEELEQSYREGTTASERVARKLEQLRERLRARQSLVPESADDPKVPEDADDSKKSEKAVGPKKW